MQTTPRSSHVKALGLLPAQAATVVFREGERVPWTGPEARTGAAGGDGAEEATFSVGQRVEYRNGAQAWRVGAVTSVAPLGVNKEPGGTGFAWDEVRPIPPLQQGDHVTCLRSDGDVPEGAAGAVLGYSADGRVGVQFAGGTWDFDEAILRGDEAVTAARATAFYEKWAVRVLP